MNHPRKYQSFTYHYEIDGVLQPIECNYPWPPGGTLMRVSFDPLLSFYKSFRLLGAALKNRIGLASGTDVIKFHRAIMEKLRWTIAKR